MMTYQMGAGEPSAGASAPLTHSDRLARCADEPIGGAEQNCPSALTGSA